MSNGKLMESGEHSVGDHHSIDRRSARANRACAACRVRKQRCILSSVPGQKACLRCAQNGTPCSFETEPAEGPQEQPGPTRLAQMVTQLQQRLNEHEVRIAELEHLDAPPRKQPRLSTSSLPPTSAPIVSQNEGRRAIPNGSTQCHNPFNDSMQQLELGAPIATLRSLGALSDGRDKLQGSIRSNANRSLTDPVESGILTETDASRAFKLYFNFCHSWAPVLNQNLRNAESRLRETSPTLFLTIVAIGARFWLGRGPNSKHPWGLHPRYPDIVKLLDSSISRLLLCASAAGASLSTIQSLLLYLQWMPYDYVEPDQEGSDAPVHTRYNEMSAWLVFGLALRYAEFCGLEQRAMDAFKDKVSADAATPEDVDAMRVWLNMVTYDCNFTLTSGMPTSLDPRPTSERAVRFFCHDAAQPPSDVRYASMVELACIIQNVRHQKNNIKERNQVISVVEEANEKFDTWRRRWFERLEETGDIQKIQMPFTSVRWYQLALNSSLLRAVLSQTRLETLPLPSWAAQPMTVSLTAASRILLSVSEISFSSVESLDSLDPSTFPDGVFLIEHEARRTLHYAVDSTWISYTFAITFLILCYLRRIIDDDLQLCPSSKSPSLLATTWPTKPRHASILHRLSRIALEIFGFGERATLYRPDHEYATVVQNATALILQSSAEAEPTVPPSENLSSIQAFFDLMGDPKWDWGIPLAEEQVEYARKS